MPRARGPAPSGPDRSRRARRARRCSPVRRAPRGRRGWRRSRSRSARPSSPRAPPARVPSCAPRHRPPGRARRPGHRRAPPRARARGAPPSARAAWAAAPPRRRTPRRRCAPHRPRYRPVPRRCAGTPPRRAPWRAPGRPARAPARSASGRWPSGVNSAVPSPRSSASIRARTVGCVTPSAARGRRQAALLEHRQESALVVPRHRPAHRSAVGHAGGRERGDRAQKNRPAPAGHFEDAVHAVARRAGSNRCGGGGGGLGSPGGLSRPAGGSAIMRPHRRPSMGESAGSRSRPPPTRRRADRR